MQPRTTHRHASALGLLLALVTVMATVLSSCDRHTPTAGPGPAQRGPARLEVATSAYPLAQLVAYIGGQDVKVTDLSPPGEQPTGVKLGQAGLATLRHAALVVVVGDGYQPAIEAAAAGARHHLSVLASISHRARPYEFWLDPTLMSKAAFAVYKALSAVDPSAERQFHNGWLDFQSVASSLESDFNNTFSTCSKSEIVTADGAFDRMAADFGLHDLAISAEGVEKAVAAVRAGSLPGVFSEVGVPAGSVQAVATAAHVKVKVLDPLEVAPGPTEPTLSYFSTMEKDLSALEGPLGCDTSEIF